MPTKKDTTQALCKFIADLKYEDIPADVVESIKCLFVDWLGSTLAGAGEKPTEFFSSFAKSMGPNSGKCKCFADSTYSSAYFAAMVNAAASHVVEQDDLHNSSVFHPATVVFSALVAVAQERGSTGKEFITAAIVGYETGIRVGEYLGRSHYVHFHTTATVGALAAAAAVANLIKLDEEKVGHAMGTAGTKAAGLWEFLSDGADSKQIHTAGAASGGLMAAYSAEFGITGAKRIFDGEHGMGAAMSKDADPSKLSEGLYKRWATVETSYKWHSSCRHTHPAADALLKCMAENKLSASQITHVIAHVHQGAIDVLGAVENPKTIHQAKFSMGTVLGLIAVYGKAGLAEFDNYALSDGDVLAFSKRVEMIYDEEVDKAYPKNWRGKVRVKTKSGDEYTGLITYPKGDPENPLTKLEIVEKAHSLAQYGGKVELSTAKNWIFEVWNIEELSDFSTILR